MEEVDRGLADELWAQLAALVDRRRQDRSLLTHLELLAEQSPGNVELRRKTEMWRRTVDVQDVEVMQLDGRLVETVRFLAGRRLATVTIASSTVPGRQSSSSPQITVAFRATEKSCIVVSVWIGGGASL